MCRVGQGKGKGTWWDLAWVGGWVGGLIVGKKSLRICVAKGSGVHVRACHAFSPVVSMYLFISLSLSLPLSLCVSLCLSLTHSFMVGRNRSFTVLLGFTAQRR